jgi:hypothetical protein
MAIPENNGCRRETMEAIQKVMDTYSPYVSAYRHMYDIENQVDQASSSDSVPVTVTMHFKSGPDQRRYNVPCHDEVAVVFKSTDGAPPPNRDIVVYPSDKPHQRIHYMSSNCDPMVYPILFPRGDLGWFSGIKHVPEKSTKVRNTVTILQFYSYRLAIREEFSPIHASGKLFQQYIVDAYVKVESSRLDFIRQNQTTLRTDLYQGLMDFVQTQAADKDLQPGKIVILPSSFQGSPRNMNQNYLDAMATVAMFGRPDIFLTFTCNPKWPEITSNLGPNQQAHNRPDLVARVFHLKLSQLLTDITVSSVLGKVKAFVYVIEFQKRGLPHCHMLIILDDTSKLRTAQDVDRLISAQIPDHQLQPHLHDVIKTCMVHGPCGPMNPSSPCMVDGQCTKTYPKDFQQATSFQPDGYPLYARPDNSAILDVGRHTVDNRYFILVK